MIQRRSKNSQPEEEPQPLEGRLDPKSAPVNHPPVNSAPMNSAPMNSAPAGGSIDDGQSPDDPQAWDRRYFLDDEDESADADGAFGDLDTDDRNPIEELASEFLDEIRAGADVSIEDYATRHAEHAELIREFFPAIIAMETVRDTDPADVASQGTNSSHEIPDQLGDLRIIRQIGRGGMGVVYEAEQESLKRRVAVKVLPNLGINDQRRRERFRREASAAAKLHHTNIVPVLGVGEQNGLHYYVMQLIRGVGLDEVIDRYAVHSGTAELTPSTDRLDTGEAPTAVDDGRMSSWRLSLTDHILSTLEGEPDGNGSTELTNASGTGLLEATPFRAVARIGMQAADAMAYAHEMRTLHRDIKPANLIVDEHGIVWITDFGLAKLAEDDDFSRTGDLVGTLRYMPPERFEGKADERSDIYSLGLTLYELVTGRAAFCKDDRAQLIRDISSGAPTTIQRNGHRIPRDLETIIQKSIARDPDDRYQTAETLSDDLRRYLDDMPIKARRASTWERSWKWCKRNPATSTLLAVCLLLFASLNGLAIAGYFHSQQLLAQEQEQRRVAEATNDLAVETLDAIYEQFAPRRREPISTRSLMDPDGDMDLVRSHPTVSDETAFLLESLLPLYGQLAELDKRDSQHYLEKSILAQRRIGDIRRQLGQDDLALDAYVAAAEQLQLLFDEDPDDLRVRVEYAALQNEIGITLRSIARDSDWREAHAEVLSILAAIDEESHSSNPHLAEDIAFEEARALYQLGRVGQSLVVPQVAMVREFGSRGFGSPDDPSDGGGSSGQWPGERRPGEFDEFMRERSRGNDGDDSASQRDDRGSNQRRGSGRSMGGRNRSGRGGIPLSAIGMDSLGDPQIIDRAVGVAQSLADQDRENPEYRLLLAKCLRERALVQGDWAIAHPDLVSSTELLLQLVADYPEIADYRFELARTLATDLSKLATGDQIDEGPDLALAIEHARQLVRENPNVTAFEAFLGLLYLKYAETEIRSGQHERVSETLWASVDINMRLFADSPDELMHRVGLFNATTLYLTLVDSRLRHYEPGETSNRDDSTNANADRGIPQRDSSDRGETGRDESGRDESGRGESGRGGRGGSGGRGGEPSRPPRTRSSLDIEFELQRMQQIVDLIEREGTGDDRFEVGILYFLCSVISNAYEKSGNSAEAQIWEDKRYELLDLRGGNPWQRPGRSRDSDERRPIERPPRDGGSD